MTIKRYQDIGKPDEKKVCESSDVIANLLSTWIVFVEKTAPSSIELFWRDNEYYLFENLLYETDQLVASQNLPAIITDAKYFSPLFTLGNEYRQYGGLFYTALLNNGVERIVVPKEVPLTNYWGHGLKKGVLEFHAETNYIGQNASGGCIINNGIICLMGGEATGGLFINTSSNLGVFPFHATGGIFVDYPLMAFSFPELFLEIDLQKDKTLSALVEQLMQNDYANYEETSSQIKKYCYAII